MTQENSLNVIIVEDDSKLRPLFTNIVNRSKKFQCIAGFGSCEEAMDYLQHHELPDMIIMDIELPGINGIEGVKIIKEKYPSIRIIMLTVYDDDDRIFQSICAGASGYLLKNSTPSELLDAIEEAMYGAPMSASIALRVLNMVRHRQEFPKSVFDLTDREKEALKCLVDGLTYKQIGEKMFIGLPTVQDYIKSVYKKLQVHSQTQAVSKAFKNNIF